MGLNSHVTAIWADNSNITRCRTVPISRYQQDDFQVNLIAAVQSLPCMYDVPLDAPVGEVQLVPNMDEGKTKATKATKTYDGSSWISHSTVFFGDMKLNGNDWNLCPRTFLRRQEDLLKTKFDITATIGFEVEFTLLLKKKVETSACCNTNHSEKLSIGDMQPADKSLYCSTRAYENQTSWNVLTAIVESLQRNFIEVYQYHAESASGQFEIALGPFGCLQESDLIGRSTPSRDPESLVTAIDKLIVARQTIYGVAASFDYHATLIPKFQPQEAGNAAHMHIKLMDAWVIEANKEELEPLDPNLFSSNPKKAAAFVAGIVSYLPSMCMLLAPTINSYERLQPKTWSGAYQAFGYENKEVPIRLVGSNSQHIDKVHRIEIKTVDGTANPYLALGAVLAVGMIGIEKKLMLEKPCQVEPSTYPIDERPAMLPQSLKEAISAFQLEADVWKSILTNEYYDLLLRLRQSEWDYFSNLSREKQLEILIHRY